MSGLGRYLPDLGGSGPGGLVWGVCVSGPWGVSGPRGLVLGGAGLVRGVYLPSPGGGVCLVRYPPYGQNDTRL